MQLESIPRTPTATQEKSRESAAIQEEPFYPLHEGSPSNKVRGTPMPDLEKMPSPQLEGRPQDITPYRGHPVSNRDEPTK